MTIIPSGAASPFDAIRRVREDGSEYWSARELMPLLGYTTWDRVPTVIARAEAAARNSGANPADHFRASSQMVPIGSGATREIDDYELTRYASYLAAMNGDPRKPKVAAAQTYFAVKTRQAETGAGELELARKYIAALEQNRALLVSNGDLAERLAELQPKADGYDDLIAAEGLFDMNTTAKILAPVTGRLGRTRFLNLLRGMRIIIQDSTLPYQHLIDRGYFAVRTDVVNGKARPSTVVTAKGLRWLESELREERPTLAGAAERTVLHLPSGQDGGAA